MAPVKEYADLPSSKIIKVKIEYVEKEHQKTEISAKAINLPTTQNNKPVLIQAKSKAATNKNPQPLKSPPTHKSQKTKKS